MNKPRMIPVKRYTYIVGKYCIQEISGILDSDGTLKSMVQKHARKIVDAGYVQILGLGYEFPDKVTLIDGKHICKCRECGYNFWSNLELCTLCNDCDAFNEEKEEALPKLPPVIPALPKLQPI